MNKEDITIFLPCFNEEELIKSAIDNFQNAGFKNIVVLDDASKDDSGKIVKALNVEVITNCKTTGFNLAVLQGVYNIKTAYALVAYNYEQLIDCKLLEQFIEFGIIGNYSLLISRDESGKSKTLSTIIKRKFGIFLQEPLFDVVFFNKTMLDIIKEKVGGTGSYVYFEIIKKAIDNKLKIGCYPLGLSRYEPKTFPRRMRMYLQLYFHQNPETYFKYAVPDIDKKEIKKQLVVAIVGYVFIRIFELLINNLIIK